VRSCWIFGIVLLFISWPASLAGQQPSLPPAADRTVDFQNDVAPVLSRHCLKCHGPDKQESNFRVDQRPVLLAGGDHGEPAVVPGKSSESVLIQAVAGLKDDLEMPPEGERLSAEEIGILRAWIDQGLVGMQEDKEAPPTTDHWSFQPIVRPPVPAPRHSDWCRNDIDALVQQRLESSGLVPSPEADRRTLLRRLYLVTLGLAPSPEQIEAFVNDWRPDAYEQAVDRVLSSPRYGERWARHWLDGVRFAETNGFETNTPRPNAFHYRDYVIRAWNSDKPYDQFVFEQLAGDLISEDAATGYLVAGAYDTVKSPDIQLTLMQRQDELADMIQVTGGVFLGLTIGCARCHNHKFDPIRQTDYYSLQAVFAGVKHGDRPLMNDELRRKDEEAAALRAQLAKDREQLEQFASPIVATDNVETFEPIRARFVRFRVMATNQGEPCLDELEIFACDSAHATTERNVALVCNGAIATSSGDYVGNPKHSLEHIHDGQYGNSYSWISSQNGEGWVEIELPETTEISRIAWARDRKGEFKDRLPTSYVIEVAEEQGKWHRVAGSIQIPNTKSTTAQTVGYRTGTLSAEQQDKVHALVDEITTLQSRIDELTGNRTFAYAGVFEQPGFTHRLYRGDPMQEREQVSPDALAVIGSLSLNADTPEQERRAALARWITDRRNPLAARVIVNRLWHFDFGSGIVSTPSDFGANGAKPTHPELLDWLASELLDHNWSLKHIQRLILTSSTFRQATDWRADAARVDAQSRLLWRYPSRRLEAEAIRDNILQVSGVLDLSMYGPGYDVFQPNDNYVRVYNPKEILGPAEWRRMIYMYKVRMAQDPVFGAFDCPDAGQAAPVRPRSTTAIQALNLFNSQFVQQQAERLAERVRMEVGEDLRAQINRAFQLTLGRQPSDDELSASLATAESHKLETVCRALLNCNEFLFVP